MCTPVGGAAAGTKAYISGEVAHRNPDGSVDVILSDGRMRQEVPLSEIRSSEVKRGGEIGDGALGRFDRGDVRSRTKVKKGSL
ncbi:unnamed protein product, partial [Laminaria digitata]